MTAPEYAGKYFLRFNQMQIPRVILVNPKYPHNVGQSFRTAEDYCVSQRNRIFAIDSMYCVNLAGAVGTVLYDRSLKEHV